jgi:fructose-bisphosphate aldolase class II
MTQALGPDLVRDARRLGYAIPAFNIVNLETAQAVIAAAEAKRAPLIIQLSPGAIAYAGYRSLTRIAFDLAERATVPVQVNHCVDPDVVDRAIDDGFGAVMFDGSRLAFDDNVAATSRIVTRAAARGVAVEAELGLIGAVGDMTLEEARAGMTSPADAARFVAATGVDILAPAIGSVHKMPVDSVALDVEHLAAVAGAAGVPLALHGGSGVDQGSVRRAIGAGVAKVNLSSNVGRALASGIRDLWAERADELDPRRYLGAGRDAVTAMAAAYLDLVGASGRAPASAAREPSASEARGAAEPAEPAGVAGSFRTGGSEVE